MSGTVLASAPTLYKRKAGTLTLTSSILTWTEPSTPTPSLGIPISRLNALFASKAGATPIRLKIDLVNPPESFNFTFTSPISALGDRESFKDHLATFVAQNRAATSAAVESSVAAAASSRSQTPVPAPGSPAPAATAAGPSTSRAGTPGARAPEDQAAIKARILTKDPALGELFQQLVVNHVITETEFWQGREHLLRLESLSSAQRPGRPSALVDPRPSSSQSGDVTITITPQLVHDIFEEYPIVQKIYVENVPKPLDETEFWVRYFHSHLFARHRASSRTDADLAKDDPIFDKYLEAADDGLEPRRAGEGVVDRLLDLGATEEDHTETGNQKDITMQAGRLRTTLPLMRRFNEHSQRLLESSLGEDERVGKRRRIEENEDELDPQGYISQIDIEDLHDPQAAPAVMLDVADRETFYVSGAASSGDGGGTAEERAYEGMDKAAVLERMRGVLRDWEADLGELVLAEEDVGKAMEDMTRSIKTRGPTSRSKDELPPTTMRQAVSCHTAACEFLRLFWSAALSSPPDRECAKRMVGFLAKTGEKVEGVALGAGTDAERVRTALRPVMDSVRKAMAYWKGMKKG